MTTTVYVPRDSSALSVGAEGVAQAVVRTASVRGDDIRLVRNGSRGLFWLEPMVEVATPAGRVAYGPVSAEDVAGLFDAGFLQGGAHDAIEAVGHDLHVRALAPAELQEAGEARIDTDATNLLVELLWRDPQQVDLLLHAFARRDLAGLPGRFDHAPQRVGEPLEQPVRGIVRSDGSVEIDENLPSRTRQ